MPTIATTIITSISVNPLRANLPRGAGLRCKCSCTANSLIGRADGMSELCDWQSGPI
jgi:hypothetical protein